MTLAKFYMMRRGKCQDLCDHTRMLFLISASWYFLFSFFVLFFWLSLKHTDQGYKRQ